jgi:hypothetical protein
MMCYQISQHGEPVALVATMALARRIVQCQPAGFYDLDTVDVGAPKVLRRAQVRRFSIKHRIRRGRSRAIKPPSPGVEGRATLTFDPARQQAN